MVIDALVLENNGIRGNGRDEVGEFDISGSYDGCNNVQFNKSYRGAHTVCYSGKRDGNGISGQWNI